MEELTEEQREKQISNWRRLPKSDEDFSGASGDLRNYLSDFASLEVDVGVHHRNIFGRRTSCGRRIDFSVMRTEYNKRELEKLARTLERYKNARGEVVPVTLGYVSGNGMRGKRELHYVAVPKIGFDWQVEDFAFVGEFELV